MGPVSPGQARGRQARGIGGGRIEQRGAGKRGASEGDGLPLLVTAGSVSETGTVAENRVSQCAQELRARFPVKLGMTEIGRE